MKLTLATEREVDGRWIAEVPRLAGVLAYGPTRDEAMAKAEVLAIRARTPLRRAVRPTLLQRRAVPPGASPGGRPQTRISRRLQ
jgi:hypothetical protein